MFLRTAEVQMLATEWMQEALLHSGLADQNEPNDFLTGISSFDFTLREVVRDVQSLCTSGMFPRPHNPRNPTMRVPLATRATQIVEVSTGSHLCTQRSSVVPNVACRSADVDVDHIDGRCNGCGEYWSLE